MQFKPKPRPQAPSLMVLTTPIPKTNERSDSLDPKEEAVLKQVREFLYQNMVSDVFALLSWKDNNLSEILVKFVYQNFPFL